MNDLAIVGGHLLDPGQGIDATASISADSGVIAGIGAAARQVGATGRQTIDATGLIVTPGLVDLHTHLYPGVSHYGIDPDIYCLGRAVTTAVDAGSWAPRHSPACAATSSSDHRRGSSSSCMSPFRA